MGEDPTWDVPVEFVPLLRLLEQAFVPERPLVGRRIHGHRADVADEILPPALVLLGGVGLEQPVERVAGVGDEPVDAHRREVLRLGHRASNAAPQPAGDSSDPATRRLGPG